MSGWLSGWLDLKVQRPADRLPPLATEIRSGPYLVRALRMTDAAEWIAIRTASRSFLEPWEASWGEESLTAAGFERRFRMVEDEWLADRGYGLLVFMSQGGRAQLIGGISLAHVRRGITQSASLGYWMAESFAGRGHMRRALPIVLDLSFGALRLHRLEAACMPENLRSRALLTACGFRLEGHAERYLKIQGSWRDHLLYGLDETGWMMRRGSIPDAQRQGLLGL